MPLHVCELSCVWKPPSHRWFKPHAEHSFGDKQSDNSGQDDRGVCLTDSAVQNTAESVCGSGQKFAGSSDIGLAERSRSDQYIRLPSKRQRQQNFATDESRTNDPKSSAII